MKKIPLRPWCRRLLPDWCRLDGFWERLARGLFRRRGGASRQAPARFALEIEHLGQALSGRLAPPPWRGGTAKRSWPWKLLKFAWSLVTPTTCRLRFTWARGRPSTRSHPPQKISLARCLSDRRTALPSMARLVAIGQWEPGGITRTATTSGPMPSPGRQRGDLVDHRH